MDVRRADELRFLPRYTRPELPSSVAEVVNLATDLCYSPPA